MIRIVTALFTIITFVVYGQGDPPTVMKGVRQTSKNISLTVELPNKQATKTGSIASRIETGNQNLLENGSFEHSALLTGHTLTNATSASEATIVTEGKKAAIITITSSGTWLAASEAYTQPGLSALVQADIKTSTTGISLCSVADAVDQNCVDIIADGLYHTYSIPSVTRSSTLGYAVKVKSGSTVSSGSFYIDNVSVGRADTIIGTYAVQSASFEAETGYGSTATKIPYFTTVARTSGGGLFSYANDSTNGLVITALQDTLITASYNKPGANSIGFGFSVNASASVTTSFVALGVANTCGIGFRNSGIGVDRGGAACTIKLAAGDTLRPHVETAATDATANVRITAQQAVNIVTAPNNNGWLTFDPAATGVQGFGTLANKECQSKRDGQDLLVRCRFTTGTVTASEARVPLIYNGTALTSADSTIIPSLQIAGGGGAEASSEINIFPNIEPSVGYITFSAQQSGVSNPTTKINGTVFTSTAIVKFYARIPISGWTGSPITGAFPSMVTTPEVGIPALYSFFASSTGVVTQDYGDLVNGNGAVTTPSSKRYTYTLNTSKFSQSPNCTASAIDTGSPAVLGVVTASTSSLVIDIKEPGVGALAVGHYVICHGPK